MKKLFLLILTFYFCGVATDMKAEINVSYGISCSTLTNHDDDGNVTDRTIIPSNLFAGVKVGTKHTVGLTVQTAIADMYEFDTKNLNSHFNPDKIQYTLEFSHNF